MLFRLFFARRKRRTELQFLVSIHASLEIGILDLVHHGRHVNEIIFFFCERRTGSAGDDEEEGREEKIFHEKTVRPEDLTVKKA